MRWRPRLVSGLIVVCVPAVVPVAPAVARAATHRTATARLQTFASCADLVGYARRNFAVTGGLPEPAIGVAEPAPIAPPQSPNQLASGQQAPAAAPAPSSASASPSFSTTNDQEAGVDEPDIVKTDGTTLFAVGQGKLQAVAVGGTAPRLVGSLDLGNDGYGAQLLLRGSRLIVISSGGGFARPLAGRLPGSAVAFPPNFGVTTTVREVDVHDPGAMKVTRTMTIDGSFVDARQNGATARLVINSAPAAIGLAAGRRAAAGAWVPSRRFHSVLSGRSYVRPVAPCRTIRRPAVFSGLGMLTIFTLDLDRGLYTADTQALMADAQIVYGSTTSLYVATQRWTDPRLALSRVPAGQTTQISRFDVSDPARTRLVATGAVAGYLLNQFSLSEYQGYLRVATTSRPIWWEGGGPPSVASSSAVTVLAERGGLLTAVGRVGGLGAGQQIYSVRFVDDAGYVVTFRQVDPLYTIDLRSPTAPRVAGQLELAGYSAYLHPLAPGLLLGVGQAVGPGNEPAGTQLELFDVSDPSAPRLIQRTLVGSGSSSEVQSDHHAFLYWPPTGLAVLPVEIYPPTPVSTTGVLPPSAAAIAPSPAGFVGAIGYHVDRSGIAEVGRIVHPALAAGYVPTIRRSVVVGPRLFTISDGGVLASSLDSLAPGAFVAFPAAPAPPPPVPVVAY
jgi:hypothetical protein